MWEDVFRDRLERRVIIVTGVVQREYEQQLIECDSDGTEDSEPTLIVPIKMVTDAVVHNEEL